MKLVERMLDLHKDLPKAKGATKTAIERRIKATDRQIDELVYGLTEKEVGIVERSPQPTAGGGSGKRLTVNNW